MSKIAVLAAGAVMLAASAANAGIINLSAAPASPNAGPATYQGYAAPNPVIQSLAAGTYLLSVVGIAGGGLYDAWTIAAPSGTNAVYGEGFHFDLGNGAGDNRVVTGSNYTSAAAALAAYVALTPTTFTLASASNVSFYLNDGAYPYFGDDSGGVSISLSQVPVAEPASLAVLAAGLVGVAGIGVARRRRAAAT